MIHRSPISTLFPYTTLFRSIDQLDLVLRPDAVGGDAHAFGIIDREAAAALVLQPLEDADDVARLVRIAAEDRKSTRLNSSHRCISYAVFCLKKKKTRMALLT